LKEKGTSLRKTGQGNSWTILHVNVKAIYSGKNR
jgi:hypothetical protein